MSTPLIILFSLLSSALSTTVYNNGVDKGYHDHDSSKRTVGSDYQTHQGPNTYHDDYNSNGGYQNSGGAVSYSHFIQEHGRPTLVQSHQLKQTPQFHHAPPLLSAPIQPIAYKVQQLPLALDRSFPVTLAKYPVQVIKPLVPYYVEKPVPVQVDRKDFVQTKVPLVYHAIYECCKDKLDHQPDYVLTKVPLVYHASFPENPPHGNGFSDYNGAPIGHRNY